MTFGIEFSQNQIVEDVLSDCMLQRENIGDSGKRLDFNGNANAVTGEGDECFVLFGPDINVHAPVAVSDHERIIGDHPPVLYEGVDDSFVDRVAGRHRRSLCCAVGNLRALFDGILVSRRDVVRLNDRHQPLDFMRWCVDRDVVLSHRKIAVLSHGFSKIRGQGG